MITDGEQTEKGGFTPLNVASQGLKDKGVAVYSLGIGRRTRVEQLQQMASSDDFVFNATGFDELGEVIVPIVKKSCPSKGS